MRAQIQSFVLWWLTFAITGTTAAVNGAKALYPGGELIVVICNGVFAVGYALILARQDSTRQIQGIHFFQGLTRAGVMATMPVIIALHRSRPEALLLVPFAYSCFYLVFELRLNRLKGDPAFYVGTQALMDRIVRWLNKYTFLVRVWPIWFLAIKAGAIWLSVKLLIWYYL